MEIALVELWAGRAEAAERRLREARQFFVPIGNVWYMSAADQYLTALSESCQYGTGIHPGLR